MNEPIFKSVVIDKSIIGAFLKFNEERRKLRLSRVKEITKILLDGKHFDAPLVVSMNDKENKYRLIDGNHRLEAISEALKINPDFSIKVQICVYKNVTREEEREIYTKWQMGAPQTANDQIANYRMTIPLINEMEIRLPISIYGSKDTIALKVFMGCHIDAGKQKNIILYKKTGSSVIEDLKNIKEADIKCMEWFYKSAMIPSFGEVNKKIPWYKGSMLSAIYRIWYDNNGYTQSYIVSQFKKIFTDKNFDVKLYGSYTTAATEAFYNKAMLKLNKNSTQHWKAYYDP